MNAAVRWGMMCVVAMLVIIAAGTTICAVNAIQQMRDRDALASIAESTVIP
jgi:hypothetical protein